MCQSDTFGHEMIMLDTLTSVQQTVSHIFHFLWASKIKQMHNKMEKSYHKSNCFVKRNG